MKHFLSVLIIGFVVISSGCISAIEQTSEQGIEQNTSESKELEEVTQPEEHGTSNEGKEIDALQIVPSIDSFVERNAITSLDDQRITFGSNDRPEYYEAVIIRTDNNEQGNYSHLFEKENQIEKICLKEDPGIQNDCKLEDSVVEPYQEYKAVVKAEWEDTTDFRTLNFTYSPIYQIGEELTEGDLSIDAGVEIKEEDQEVSIEHQLSGIQEDSNEVNMSLVDSIHRPTLIDSKRLTEDFNEVTDFEYSEDDIPSYLIIEILGDQEIIVIYSLNQIRTELDPNIGFLEEGEFETDNVKFSIDSIQDYEDNQVEGLNHIEFDYYFENKGIPVTEARDGIDARIELKSNLEESEIDYINLANLREGEKSERNIRFDYVEGDSPQMIEAQFSEHVEKSSLILNLD